MIKNSLFFLLLLLLWSCTDNTSQTIRKDESRVKNDTSLAMATLAGGCFWCVEAAIEQVKGVENAVSGYSGGSATTADYKKVSSGVTNHAEAVQVYYDPEQISYRTLLEIFFTAHDPTQLNRQGPDIGAQYRSEIFFHDDEQRKIAQSVIDSLSEFYNDPIVTRVSEYQNFFPAEKYHQDYYEHNPGNSYVQNVSRPKVEKVAKKYKNRLKEEYRHRAE